MKSLLEEVFKRYPKRREIYERKLLDSPKCSHDIPKVRLYIRLKQNATRLERQLFKNNLLNFIKDDTVIVFDRNSFIEDINQRMSLLDIFNAAVSIISFALGCF